MPINNRLISSTDKNDSAQRFFRQKLVPYACCIAFLFIGGCSSKAQYEKVSADYLIAQEQNKQLIEGCASKTLYEQVSANYLIDHEQNKQLIKQIKNLNQKIKEQEAVISLQMTVVRLFDDQKQTLQSNIKKQIAALDLESSAGSPPTAINLTKNLYFQPGSASLNVEGKKQLMELKGLFSGKDYVHVQVAGHTDNSPLKKSDKYANNLELSVARATSVAKYLNETFNVGEEKISVAGFGQYLPIASNNTVDGRYKNRRIEINLETTQ